MSESSAEFIGLPPGNRNALTSRDPADDEAAIEAAEAPEAASEQDEAPEPPPVSAPKAEWVEHVAATTDLTPEEAEAKTKAELIEEHKNEISRLEQEPEQS